MVASAIKPTARDTQKTSYRWLQFWGDVRHGLHSSWRDAFASPNDEPLSAAAHHHHGTALMLRDSLGVSASIDDNLLPEFVKWSLLQGREFDTWCEAVGLLSLGEHLKRVLSVRAAERLQISLDRRELAAILQFINTRDAGETGPLPLHIPTARVLGARAIAAACEQEAPRFWSRLKLRLDKSQAQLSEKDAAPLPYQPTLSDLSKLDLALFERSQRTIPPRTEESLDKWTQTQTLSA
ncbi:MAG: hypothetical protein RIR70_1772 [Pseudomonadota bacterium]|jgi:hypothetical protein